MDEIEVLEEYLTGFNQGYYLQGFVPELFKMISEGVDTVSDYFMGFNDGGLEFEQERIRLELGENTKDKDLDIGFER